MAVIGNSLQKGMAISQQKIREMYLEMKKLQKTFHSSGGSHAAAIFNKNNQLLTIN